MKTIPYRCDNSRHKALLGAARSTGTSVQRLFDNFVTHVIAERQAEAQASGIAVADAIGDVQPYEVGPVHVQKLRGDDE